MVFLILRNIQDGEQISQCFRITREERNIGSQGGEFDCYGFSDTLRTAADEGAFGL
jgi:hypothetical protein